MVYSAILEIGQNDPKSAPNPLETSAMTTTITTYDHAAIEQKWQQRWLDQKTFKVEIDHSKPKYYVLDMFPYPSGDGLHVGHPEGYTATDIIARYKRMKGFNVLHPMGWDAFGLPAERHAMRTGEHPAVITNKNCDTFRAQIQRLGLSYDWDREINTTDPKYYRWTQWIFQVLYERGLAYQTEAPVNWCPAQGTVLANEEVKDGKYVDTGDPVEKRQMRQWMLKITAYADKLLKGLDDVDWPEGIKTQQREWIGRSEGADIVFEVTGSGDQFTVFSTRPDTLFGATFCVLAPEHSLVNRLATDAQRAEVDAYVDAASKRSAQDRMKEDREKTGVFTGAYAVNPANGKEIPIWIADYVLAEYGYGAIMAVPGQDERDWEFAEKFGLDIIRTVQPPEDWDGKAYIGEGPAINSGFLDGLGIADAKRKMIDWLEANGKGKGTVNYKLRDWLFSRQRYWGEPFPLIELEDGTTRAVPMKDLPVTLPVLDEYKPTDDGQPPLARATDWVQTTDPETGKPAKRETNTMPQWAGSCWYFLRYIDPNNDDLAWSEEAEKYWMPVDLYIGGAEHAVLHLLYSRFWHKVLYDAGHVSTKEPFAKLFNQGMIVAFSYREISGQYRRPHEVEHKVSESVSFTLAHGVEDENPVLFLDEEIDPGVIHNDANEWGSFLFPTKIYSHHGLNIETTKAQLSSGASLEVEIARAKDTGELVPRRSCYYTFEAKDGRYLRAFEYGSDRSTGRYAVEEGSNDKTPIRKSERYVLNFKSAGGVLYDQYFVRQAIQDRSVGGNKLLQEKWFHRVTGEQLKPVKLIDKRIEKMSKSRYNVVNPDDVVRDHGADSMRLYEMFMGPLERDKPWTDEGVQGVHRFLRRAWALFVGEDGALNPKIVKSGGDEATDKALHAAIKAVGDDIEHLQFNTAIARMMEFVNTANKAAAINRDSMERFALILAPFAPHIAEEVWERMGHDDTLAYEPWPAYDESKLTEETIEIPVQINGKVRAKLQVNTDASKDDILSAAKADQAVQRHTADKTIVKEIYVPGRMVNLVVK
jgi:leucyl-tRNA synthetase